MTTHSNWVFPRSKLLRIAKVGEETFERFLRTGIIPSPNKILWLVPPSEEECLPGYVLADILHLSYLEASGISTLWELQKFTLGAYGQVKHETDLRRLCGELPLREIQSDKGNAREVLCRTTEESLRSQKIVAATFRHEVVEGTNYLILSRAVLRPRAGLFKVEFVQSESEDPERKLTDVFRTISEGEIP